MINSMGMANNNSLMEPFMKDSSIKGRKLVKEN